MTEKKEVEVEVKPKTVEEDKAATLTRISEILAEYNNMESNIPYTHEYWHLVNLYRTT